MALLSGCAQTKDWLDSVRGGDSSDEPAIHVPSADEYLETLRQLTTGDPATQAEIYAEAESLSTLTPYPSTNLRFVTGFPELATDRSRPAILPVPRGLRRARCRTSPW